MKTILGVLVFMLVHGRAVCESELYPISIFKDIAQYQNDYNNSYTEPAQGKALVNPPNVAEDVQWIVDKIVGSEQTPKKEKPYGGGFEKYPTKDEWKSQPTFEGWLGTQKFIEDGNEAEEFFKKPENNDWNKLKARNCLDLLYITAARYLLVTKILYEQSGKKLTACVKTVYGGGLYEIPDSGVCFPPPYGSATCTSDYDVGLIGINAGILTRAFNDHFTARFGKPSEVAFDTNIYAFTLEYALPAMFVKLKPAFVDGLKIREEMIKYQMQELASAYYKVFKYNEDSFNTLVTGAKDAIGAVSLKELNTWLNIFNTLPVPLRAQDFVGAGALRASHNDKYQELVEKMSNDGGYNAESLGTLAKALIYAAEAYHTRGAIRHVVGGFQMKMIDMSQFSKDLSMNDLWVSMIENWGESNKEYNHYCLGNNQLPLVTCLTRMSKYMWRMFNAMRMIRARSSNTHGLVNFGQEFGDPEHLSNFWLKLKKKGLFNIPMDPKQIQDVKSFLTQFGCNQAVIDFGNNVNAPLPAACLVNMNYKVNDYNVKLAASLK